MFFYLNIKIRIIIYFKVILPHIGSATYTTRNLMAATTEENILDYFEGNPLVSELLF
jgi:lactate dehydrogenase-like 2-hydroxyacid dehydrogenase